MTKPRSYTVIRRRDRLWWVARVTFTPHILRPGKTRVLYWLGKHRVKPNALREVLRLNQWALRGEMA